MLERFLAALQRPAEVQRETLGRLVGQLAKGRFGREHGLGRLASGDVDAFRRAVPLRDFEGLRAYIEPSPSDLSGETPLYLLRTSASTGKPKLIPYTASFRDSIKRAHDAFTEALFRDTPSLPMHDPDVPRAIGLYQLSTANEHALGLPVDSYVSRLYDVALPDDPFFFAFDATPGGRDVCKIADARERLFAMALVGAKWDVRALRATNPTTLLLLARVLDEEGERFCRALHERAPERARALADRPLTPRALWPNLELLVTWRGGTCHLFEPHLRQAFGTVRIRAPIFAASEGVVAVPLSDDELGGAPAIESTFFELLPEGASDTILLHEARQGQRYELVFTAPTGMARYRIGDLVQVDGLVGNTPAFHFLARKGRTSSVTGEKLTELQIDEAMSHAARSLDLQPVHFVVSPQIEALPYYVLSVDMGDAKRNLEPLAGAFDDALMALNVEYEAKRKSARLGPVRLRRCRRGAFEALQAKGLSGGGAINFKLAHLSSEPVHAQLGEETP